MGLLGQIWHVIELLIEAAVAVVIILGVIGFVVSWAQRVWDGLSK